MNMGVRKVTNNRFKSIFLFPSLKMGKQVWADSPLEEDYLHLLDPDGEVTFFKEQPLKIYYTLAGKSRIYSYTPDFLVRRGDKIQIVEVKPITKVYDAKNQLLFRIATRACREKGYDFIVVTDEFIRRQPRLDNLKAFRRYATIPVGSPRLHLYCHDFFSSTPEARIDELARFFESKRVSKGTVYSLLYWGVLHIDLMKPVGGDSLVSYPSLQFKESE
jgi:hypothetical protein